MSWLFSRALVAEYSAASCSDGEPSAPLSGNPTQLAYLPPDKMTAFSRPSRFGMTFRPLTAVLGEAVLMSYLAGFPAKTSALPAKEQESPENAAECGDTWRGSLARFDPVSSSWKTVQHSLLEDSASSSVTWPRSGMTAGGRCWELQMSGRRIRGTGFGLWATPSATDGQRGGTITDNMTGVSLAQMVNTPTVCGNYNRKGASATSADGLATAVKRWPTPRAQDSYERSNWKTIADANEGGKSQMTLTRKIKYEARMWPTPTAHNAKETNAPSEANRNTPTLAAQAGGQLNPTWVEWLMGWPLGWTDLKPLEMDKSPCAPQQLGDS